MLSCSKIAQKYDCAKVSTLVQCVTSEIKIKTLDLLQSMPFHFIYDASQQENLHNAVVI